MVALETRFHGPTNFKGARISVRCLCGSKRTKFYSWNHALNPGDNHEAAVAQYVREQELVTFLKGTWVLGETEHGVVAVFSFGKEPA